MDVLTAGNAAKDNIDDKVSLEKTHFFPPNFFNTVPLNLILDHGGYSTIHRWVDFSYGRFIVWSISRKLALRRIDPR
jgi:hypothetical protein